MNTNTQAEIEQETLKLNPDFGHRLLAFNSFDRFSLTDCIGMMTDRALGVLHLLSGQFEDDNYRMSDALICGAIDATIQEIEDIKAIIRAYHQNENSKPPA
ncbi:MAG: hypothetical protein WCP01_02030 [Methylococcaceae bacterium]